MFDRPTPRYTPFLSSCSIWSELAGDYAARLDAGAREALALGLEHRVQKCRELAMKMRYLQIELGRIAKSKSPSTDALRDVVVGWKDAEAEANLLRLPPGKVTSWPSSSTWRCASCSAGSCSFRQASCSRMPPQDNVAPQDDVPIGDLMRAARALGPTVRMSVELALREVERQRRGTVPDRMVTK